MLYDYFIKHVSEECKHVDPERKQSLELDSGQPDLSVINVCAHSCSNDLVISQLSHMSKVPFNCWK